MGWRPEGSANRQLAPSREKRARCGTSWRIGESNSHSIIYQYIPFDITYLELWIYQIVLNTVEAPPVLIEMAATNSLEAL